MVKIQPIVVVTAPGPGSGKLATCLSQLYHEYKRGNSAGYSKFETFPVWNVPLKHPLNIAYEAATVDLKDVNMIDSFHLDAYGETAVNYNRDIESFPVLKRIIEKITGKESVYKSPTDMGVNRVGFGIVDDEVVREASKQAGCEYKKGYVDKETFDRSRLIMEEVDLKESDRAVVMPARKKAEAVKEEKNNEACSVVAIELEDGTIITGKNSELMNASAAAIINSIKHLANISDDIYLMSPVILEPITKLKEETLGAREVPLALEEVLLALSICAATNPQAQAALDKIKLLKNCQAHSTTILSSSDEKIFGKLGIDVTCDAEYPTESLFWN